MRYESTVASHTPSFRCWLNKVNIQIKLQRQCVVGSYTFEQHLIDKRNYAFSALVGIFSSASQLRIVVNQCLHDN